MIGAVPYGVQPSGKPVPGKHFAGGGSPAVTVGVGVGARVGAREGGCAPVVGGAWSAVLVGA